MPCPMRQKLNSPASTPLPANGRPMISPAIIKITDTIPARKLAAKEGAQMPLSVARLRSLPNKPWHQPQTTAHLPESHQVEGHHQMKSPTPTKRSPMAVQLCARRSVRRPVPNRLLLKSRLFDDCPAIVVTRPNNASACAGSAAVYVQAVVCMLVVNYHQRGDHHLPTEPGRPAVANARRTPRRRPPSHHRGPAHTLSQKPGSSADRFPEAYSR
jgi:hypothetical protein